jgi:hypothetical protein
MPRFFNRLTSSLLILMISSVLVMPAQADKRRPYLVAQAKPVEQYKSQLTAREAAARARSQYGGKVLKVDRAGKNFKVRLLQDSGRVITVTIRG